MIVSGRYTNLEFPIDITKYAETQICLADVTNPEILCHTVIIRQGNLNNTKNWVGGYYYKPTDYRSFNIRTNTNGIFDAIITTNGVQVNKYNTWIEVWCR